MVASVLARLDVRERMTTGAGSARHHALVLPGWDLWARHTTTGVEIYLGWIDAEASPKQLTDRPLADGVYEIEIRPAEFFWQDCRGRKVVTMTVTAGLFKVGLPSIQDLACSVAVGTTTITWRVVEEQSGSFDFGVWYSATSPVDTSGAPAAIVTHYPGVGDYQVTRVQSADEYVAVATRSGGDKGEVSELYLPWSTTTPTSPADQYAYRRDDD